MSCQTEGKCSGTQDQRGREGKARTWNAGQSFSSARARRQLVGRRGQGEELGRRVTGQGGAWGGDCICGVGVGGCGQSLRTGRPRFKQVCGQLVVMEREMAKRRQQFTCQPRALLSLWSLGGSSPETTRKQKAGGHPHLHQTLFSPPNLQGSDPSLGRSLSPHPGAVQDTLKGDSSNNNNSKHSQPFVVLSVLLPP